MGYGRQTASLPAARAKALAYAHAHVASPRPVVSQVGETQILVACAQPVEQEMLGDTKLETFGNVDSSAPGMFNANRIGRPRVERLGNGLAEQERGCPKDHQAPQWATAERPYFQNSREHIAREQAAGGIDSAVLSGIAGAQIGINLVVWGREVELRPAPKHVVGKEH